MIIYLHSSLWFEKWVFKKESRNPLTNKGHVILSSVQFSHSVVSDSLRPHGLQHARPPCPSPTPAVYSNSCPLSQWCHPTISTSVIPFLPLSIFPSIRVLSNESVLRIRCNIRIRYNVILETHMRRVPSREHCLSTMCFLSCPLHKW